VKRLIKFGSVGLVIAGAISIGGEAFAQLPTLFRVEKPTPTGIRASYFIKSTPRTQVEVELSGGVSTKTLPVRSNACGIAVLSSATKYNGLTLVSEAGSFQPETILAGAAVLVPECLPNGQLATPLPSGSGSIINGGSGRIILVGLTPDRVRDVTYSSPNVSKKFVSTDACGIGSLTSSSSGFTQVNLSGVTTALSALPLQNFLCRSGVVFSKSLTAPLPVTATANGKSVSVSGLPPLQPYPFTVVGGSVTISATTDRCGGLTLGTASNPLTGTIQIKGVSFDTTTVGSGAKPNCVLNSNGSYSYQSSPSNVRLSNGQLYIYQIPGLSLESREIVPVTSGANRVVNQTANSCGIATYKSSNLLPTSLISLNNAAAVEVSTFPIAETPVCRDGDILQAE